MPKATSKSRARPTSSSAASNKAAKVKHTSTPEEEEDSVEDTVEISTTTIDDDWTVDYCLIQNPPCPHSVPVHSKNTVFQSSSHLEYKTLEQAREAVETCAARNLLETCFTIVRIPRTKDTDTTHAIMAIGCTKDGQVYYEYEHTSSLEPDNILSEAAPLNDNSSIVSEVSVV